MLNSYIKPMLLNKKETPFSDDNYIFEWKVDGVRCIAHIDQQNKKVFLHSRHGKDCTIAFPELQSLIECTSHNVILDGELTVLNDYGKPDFEATMRRYLARNDMLVKKLPVQYIVWDILFNGKDLTNLPLEKRKEILLKIVKPNDTLKLIDYIPGNGIDLFEGVKKLDLEGIVAKRKDSRYCLDTRSSEWLKIKNYRQSECLILGYRIKEFCLYLGQEREDGHIQNVGICEFGMNANEKAAFLGVAKDIEVRRNKNFVWLKPLIKCKIQHTGTTGTGKLREPIFKEFVAKPFKKNKGKMFFYEE